jgi:hypothetical protein
MNLKNWRECISKVIKVSYSKHITIPVIIANEMGLDENSYVYMKYDEKTKSLTIKKSEKGSE